MTMCRFLFCSWYPLKTVIKTVPSGVLTSNVHPGFTLEVTHNIVAHPKNIHCDLRTMDLTLAETTKDADKLDAALVSSTESLAPGSTLLSTPLGGAKISTSAKPDRMYAPNVLIRGDNRVKRSPRTV